MKPIIFRPELNQPIYALSWKQPYASLMLPPHNKIETRTWKTDYRGIVLICASAQAYKTHQVHSISGEQMFRINEATKDHDAAIYKLRGHAIGIGRLVDCLLMMPEDEDRCFVEYSESKRLWCHVYEDVYPIHPFPFKGSQRWTSLTDDQKNKIEIL